MLVSLNELREYVDIDIPLEELKDLLTLRGLEVAAIKEFSPYREGLVIGEISEKKKHPNADRLSLTKVKYLEEKVEKEVPVVCGATNFGEGDKVILATPGTLLSDNWKIKKSKIRGEESCGMICSKAELGLEEKSEGIWVLPSNLTIQDKTEKILSEKDFILDIDLTSNRSDCLSVWGVAREVSAYLEKSLKEKKVKEYAGEKNYSISIDIENDKGCPLYFGVVIKNVAIKESPAWLQEKLFKHEIRSINNVVDITNLMLVEYAQPMHAFDYDKIRKKIIVRDAREKEEFTSLENKTYQLTGSDLVIADEEKVIGLAGVIGGNNSEVSSTTKDIVLEAAYFHPQRIRKTAKKLAINSDAAYTFSRDVDGSRTSTNLKLALDYFKELTGGEIGDITEANTLVIEEKKITLFLKDIERVLRLGFSLKEISALLARLQIKTIFLDNEKIEVSIPPFRKDINYSWDLIEEVARIYGYEKFPNTLPAIRNANYFLEVSLEEKVRPLLQGLGYHEVMTYPFIENNFIDKINDNLDEWVIPQNPLLVNISLLRKNLLFGFLKTVKLNSEKNQKDLNKIFEIGRVFGKRDEKHYEEEKIAFAGWGEKEIRSWHANQANHPYDFYDLKGDLQEAFKHLSIKNFSLKENENNYFASDGSASILVNGEEIGFLGLIKNNLLDYFALKNKNIYYVEISLTKLNQLKVAPTTYQTTSKYPSVFRDLAIVIDKDKVIGELIEEIKRNSSLLTRVDLQDIYQGKGLSANKKSIVFHLEFSSLKKTLSREEADNQVKKIVKGISKKYDFELR